MQVKKLFPPKITYFTVIDQYRNYTSINSFMKQRIFQLFPINTEDSQDFKNRFFSTKTFVIIFQLYITL